MVDGQARLVLETVGKLEKSTGAPASGPEEQRAFKPFLQEADALGVLPNTLHPVGKTV